MSIQQESRQQPAACNQSKVLHYSVRSAGNTIENVFAKDLLSFINSKQQGPALKAPCQGSRNGKQHFSKRDGAKMEAQTRFQFRRRKSFKEAKSNVGHPSVFPPGLFTGATLRKITCRLTVQTEIVKCDRKTDRGIAKKKQRVS